MLGVTFGSKHSYNDWGIWLEDTHINPPLPKRYRVDVPARNGLLDLTPELTPTIRFDNRTLTFNFRVKAGDWSTLVSQIYGDIHGRTLDVVSDLDPNWHWHGCVTVDDFSSDERTGKLVITVDADPFKLSNTENSYTVNGDGTITCEVDRMEISPAFELTAPTTVIYGDSSYTIESTATTEKTLSGDIVSFADGTANPAVDLTADIEAVQDLHGYDAPWVGGAGKNKLQVNVESRTVNDVTFTINADGTVKVSGTASASVYFPLAQFPFTQGVSYTLSGCPASISGANLYAALNEGNKVDGGTGVTFIPEETQTAYIRIAVYSGNTINATFKPMVELGSAPTAFEPYTNICPISGWDEVNVTRTGKNLYIGSPSFDGYVNRNAYTLASETYNGHEVIQKTSTWNGAYKEVPVLAGKTYTFSAMVKVSSAVNVYIYDVDNERLSYQYVSANTWTRVQATFTASKSRLEHLRVEIGTANTTIYLSEYQLEVGSTATDYEPYQGQTYTIDLNGTRYGGTLDVTTGVLTVTHGIVDLGTLTWSLYYGTVYANVIGAKLPQSGAIANIICSQYKASNITSVLAKSENGIIAINEGQSRVNLYDASLSDKTAGEVKTALNGVQLVYELATPQVVQLTAEQVMILKNQNNIWTDSGEVEVTYLAQDFAGKKFFIPDLELTEGSHELTIQGTGTTKVTYTNGRL